MLKGLVSKINKYDKLKREKQAFYQKYGKDLDVDKLKIIILPSKSYQKLVVIPFKSNSLNQNKVLIAYYQNNKKQFWIFKYKQYTSSNKKLPFFMDYLDVLFLNDTKKEVKKRSNDVFGNCIIIETVYFNECITFFTDSCGRTWISSEKGCEETTLLDEVEINGNSNESTEEEEIWDGIDYDDDMWGYDDEEDTIDLNWEFDSGNSFHIPNESAPDFEIIDSLTGKSKCVYDKLKNNNIIKNS